MKLVELLLSLFNKKPDSLNTGPVFEAPTTPAVVGKDTAAQFIARWEGCKLTAYQDVVGIWTIGYGRTTNVHPGDTCTQEQADSWLAEEVETFRRGVRGAVLVPLNDNQLAACTSLAYNIGLAAFRGSTLLRKLNDGDYQGAADQFLVWNKAGGRVVQGLVNRRSAERDLFLKG